MRAFLINMLQYNGHYGCHLCEQGMSVERSTTVSSDGKVTKSFRRYWAYQERIQMRHHSDYVGISGMWPALSEQDQLGIKQGGTPLYRLQGFDIVKQIPLDILHLLYEGVVKHAMYLTFKIKGKTRKRVRQMPMPVRNHVIVKVPFPGCAHPPHRRCRDQSHSS